MSPQSIVLLALLPTVGRYGFPSYESVPTMGHDINISDSSELAAIRRAPLGAAHSAALLQHTRPSGTMPSGTTAAGLLINTLTILGV